jgi:hypothetical protein
MELKNISNNDEEWNFYVDFEKNEICIDNKDKDLENDDKNINDNVAVYEKYKYVQTICYFAFVFVILTYYIIVMSL